MCPASGPRRSTSSSVVSYLILALLRTRLLLLSSSMAYVRQISFLFSAMHVCDHSFSHTTLTDASTKVFLAFEVAELQMSHTWIEVKNQSCFCAFQVIASVKNAFQLRKPSSRCLTDLAAFFPLTCQRLFCFLIPHKEVRNAAWKLNFSFFNLLDDWSKK